MPSNLNLLQHSRNLVLFKELGSVLLSPPPLYSFSVCPSLVSEVFHTYSLRTDWPTLFDCSPDLLFRNILLRLWTYEKVMSKGFKIKRGAYLRKISECGRIGAALFSKHHFDQRRALCSKNLKNVLCAGMPWTWP